MSDTTSMRKITFSRSRPMGYRGTFEHNGEMWVAYPASKNQRVFSVIDRLLGQLGKMQREMIQWINMWPTDAERVGRVLALVNDAKRFHDELSHEKVNAMMMGSQLPPAEVGIATETVHNDEGEYLATQYDHRPMGGVDEEPDGLESQED